MSEITTHVLDTARGQPAAGVDVVLERRDDDGVWRRLGVGSTDAEGRLGGLLGHGALHTGVHRLTFATGAYLARALNPSQGFYPEVSITFAVADPAEHHHVPLLLSPYGYTTYRGS